MLQEAMLKVAIQLVVDELKEFARKDYTENDQMLPLTQFFNSFNKHLYAKFNEKGYDPKIEYYNKTNELVAILREKGL